MKFFAANLLADAFGRRFGALDPREIECKYDTQFFATTDLGCFLTLTVLYRSLHVQSRLHNPSRARSSQAPEPEPATSRLRWRAR